MKKRLLSMMLVVSMVMIMLPALTFAASGPVNTWAALVAAVNAAPADGSQTVIEIGANLDANSQISIITNKDIVIQSDSENRIITRNTSFASSTLFNVNAGGKLTLKNTTLDGNGSNVTATAPIVFIYSTGEFTMDGATIQNVKGNVDFGQPAGIFIQANGNMTMKNSSVIKNVVNNATNSNSAFYVAGTLNMVDSSVTNCTGTFCGGVGVYLGTFNMSGNSSITNGKGDFGSVLLSTGTFNLSGTPNISGNTKTNGTTPCNVFLYTSRVINVVGTLNNTTPIGVSSYSSPSAGSPINITTASDQDWSGYFTSDNPSYVIENTGSGSSQVLKLAVRSTINVSDSSGTNLPTGVTYNSTSKLFTISTGTTPTTINVIGTTSTNSIVVDSGVSNLTLILNGVSITSPISGNSPIDLQGTASVTIQLANSSANTLNAIDASGKAGLHVPSTATVIINGTGSLTVTGGYSTGTIAGAGIGGGDNEEGGTITINGGTITASGGTSNSVIGGAGIGGGNKKAGGTININGGTITAMGGNFSSGIGGGNGTSGGNGAGGNITISGGNVTATGNGGGAGIGGGNGTNGGNGAGGNITISGGNITATGSGGGAGIGGGNIGSAGPINISGGTITAISPGDGAGIGCGISGSGSTINISGNPVIMAVSYSGNGSSKSAIYATGGSGSIINAKLNAIPSASATTYLVCNSNKLPLPANSKGFAFYPATNPTINAYSDSGCNNLLGNIVQVSDSSANIAVTNLSSGSATPTPVMLYKTYTATVNLMRDGSAWLGSGKVITLQQASETPTSTTESNGVFTANVGNGTWKVLSGATDTGSTVVINNAAALQDLNYYTVTLSNGTGIASTTGSGTYLSGSNVSINATVSSGYSWSKWTQTTSGADVSSTQNYQITNITAHQSYKANATTNSSGGGGGGGSGGGSGGSSGGTLTQTPTHVPVIVDGKDYYIGDVAVEDNTATITVDQSEFDKQLAAAKQSVVVPVSSDASTIVAQLVVKNVEDMNNKGVPLSVQTGNINYNIPASSIDTKAIISALGATDPSLAPVNLTIRTNVDAVTQAIVDSAISTTSVKEIIPAVQFEISANFNGKTYDIVNFDNFVSRSVEITQEQAQQITTAIVINPDRTVRHVPTFVYQKDGKWYAQINSRTNSTYVLIYNQMSFSDAEGKWYQTVVNEMGSRKIISGVDSNSFAGDKAITRAEFAAILVRALGLPSNGMATFSDVPSDSWYSGAVATAAQYGIVCGVGNNKFAPNDNITREQAMQMIYNASRLTPYVAVTGADNTKSFTDYGTHSAWATDAVNFNLNNGFIQGYNGLFNPKSNITRAETATVVLKLLQKSGLVDIRTKL